MSQIAFPGCAAGIWTLILQRLPIATSHIDSYAVVTLRPKQTKGTIKFAVIARSRLNPREAMAAIPAWRSVKWDGV